MVSDIEPYDLSERCSVVRKCVPRDGKRCYAKTLQLDRKAVDPRFRMLCPSGGRGGRFGGLTEAQRIRACPPGVNCCDMSPLHTLRAEQNPDCRQSTLAQIGPEIGFERSRVDETLVEPVPAALLDELPGIAHYAIEHARPHSHREVPVHGTLGPEVLGQILPLGPVIQDPEDAAQGPTLVHRGPAPLGRHRRIGQTTTFSRESPLRKYAPDHTRFGRTGSTLHVFPQDMIFELRI